MSVLIPCSGCGNDVVDDDDRIVLFALLMLLMDDVKVIVIVHVEYVGLLLLHGCVFLKKANWVF